jgi:hypothetical protein
MSAKPYAVHICSLQSVPDVTQKMTYEELRTAVLKAGRFSTFEASANPRAAMLFTRLCRDPTLETTPKGFPWTEVRERATQKDKP